MVCYLIGLGAFALGFVAAVVGLARRYRHRWLVPVPPVTRGEGAFRTGPVTPDLRRQRRRFFIFAVAIVHVVWATATLFVLVPAGALGALLGLEQGNWFWSVIGLAVLDGIPLSIIILSASLALVRRLRKGLRLARVSGVWSLAHHLALVAAGFTYELSRPYSDGLGTFTVITAGLGALLAAAALAAQRMAGDEMPPADPLLDDDELAELGAEPEQVR